MSGGLTGEYFNSTYSATSNLTQFVVARNDDPTTFSFNWGNSAPATGVNPDTFSVRWEGTFKAPVSGTYTFYVDPDTNSNGGTGGDQLWVNTNLVVSNTAAHATEDSGTLSLSFNANTVYNLKLEYYNYTGPAYTQLQYSAANSSGGSVLAKQVVPTANTLNDLTTTQSYTAGVPNLTAPATTTFTGAPAGWSGDDIGQPTPTGSSSYSGGIYSVSGGGTLQGGTNDQFQYAYQQISGDFTYITRLVSMTEPNNGAMAGIMLRNGFTASSPEIFIGSQHSGVPYATVRTNANALEKTIAAYSSSAQVFPYWLELVRYAGQITAYYAPDVSGSPGSWIEQVGQSFNNLPETVSVGLAVGARTSSAVCTATFDNVSVTSLNRIAETSFVANSFAGGTYHVMDDAATAYVDQSGNLYLNGFDEDESLSIYNPDGSIYAFGSSSHYESGSAVTADTTFIYQAQLGNYNYSSDGVQLYDHNGFAVDTAVLGCDDITGLATTPGFLYVATDNLIFKFSTSSTATPAFVTCWEVDSAGNIAADQNNNLWIVQNAIGSSAAQVVHQTPTGGSAGGSITFTNTTNFPKTVVPKGIAVALTGSNVGNVYVTDVGQLQQVHIFNSSGTFLSHFGVQYGAYGNSGNLTASSLIFPVGIGLDSNGDMYVVENPPGHGYTYTASDLFSGAGNGGGTIIEKFGLAGQLLWERNGMCYVDVAAADPGNPNDVYTSMYHFTMNYNATVPGAEATLVGVLGNPFATVAVNGFNGLADPRFEPSGIATSGYSGDGIENGRAGVVVEDIGGSKFLYDFDQHASAVNIYRFLPGSQITVFCGELLRQVDRYKTNSSDGFYIWIDTNGDGVKQAGEESIAVNEELGGGARESMDWYIDPNGNIWTADGGINTIREYLVDGINGVGAPVYLNYTGTNTTYDISWAVPSRITEVNRVVYDPGTDTIYLSGYTTGDPRPSGDTNYGTAGTELLRYSNWKGGNSGLTANYAWDAKLPYTPNAGGDTSKPINITCIYIAGNYVFAGSVSGFYGVEVFLANTTISTGDLVSTILAGPEIAGDNALVDFRNGMNVTELPNGQYEIFEEEGLENKSVLYRWTPGVTLPAEEWTSQDIGIAATGPAGSATFNNPTGTVATPWTVAGSGMGITGISDQFQLTSQAFSGDGTVVAKVSSLTGGNTLAKAGVIFRDSNATNAMFVDTVFEPDDGNGAISFAWRSATGANANGTTYLFPTATPSAYVELVRQGNGFTGYFSTDGITWTQAGSVQNIPINSTALAGLAVSSQQSTGLATALFSGVHLNSGLVDTDIGSPAKPGSGVFNDFNNTWNISGGGADIGGTSDQFNFASVSHIGDGTIIGQVQRIVNTTATINASAKAGLMFRAATGAADYNATIFVTPGNGVEFQYRNSSTGSSNTSIAALATPIWLELTRSGNNFSGYYSLNGVNWIQVGTTVGIGMGSSAAAGLAVTSHDNTSLVTGVFANVSITGAVAGITPSITPDTIGALSLPAGSRLIVSQPDTPADRTVLIASSLILAANSQLDLMGNDLIVHAANVGSVNSLLASGYASGSWNGVGIMSSTAASDSTHLTALGYMTGGISFDGVSTSATDVLVKYTYYGDATLDGKVDGSDYSKIDSALLTKATGWQNGDFNYDGVLNGSDYTLIDNAFNTQRAILASQIALVAQPPKNVSRVSIPSAMPADEPAIDPDVADDRRKKQIDALLDSGNSA